MRETLEMVGGPSFGSFVCLPIVRDSYSYLFSHLILIPFLSSPSFFYIPFSKTTMAIGRENEENIWPKESGAGVQDWDLVADGPAFEAKVMV